MRGRTTTRPSGDERIQAILTNAEELLGQRPLADISVDDLARGAGISRPTFYFYFSSKEAVLLTLAERIIEEADANVASINPAAMTSPAEYWRAVIKAYFDAFGSHRSLTVALSGMQGTGTELDQRWAEVTENWVANTTVGIEAERTRGAAPNTIPARDISIALNLINQSMMRATFTGEQPAVADDDVVDTLLHVWLNAIYGGVCA
ncbi:AcrR family transcriptional regulator [Mycobacteroides chelonae]|nr:AcrR family transcriptional regulator [Mycobacteroides chelonae]